MFLLLLRATNTRSGSLRNRCCAPPGRIAACITSTGTKALLSSSSSTTTSSSSAIRIDYVHPLSQIVLEHLQSTRKDWVMESGLSDTLKLQSDGTFEMRFPTSSSSSSSNSGGDDDDHDRIYTRYDGKEKKHWLIVRKGGMVGRYLLQDNLKHAWRDDARSTPERIREAVDDMIEKIK